MSKKIIALCICILFSVFFLIAYFFFTGRTTEQIIRNQYYGLSIVYDLPHNLGFVTDRTKEIATSLKFPDELFRHKKICSVQIVAKKIDENFCKAMVCSSDAIINLNGGVIYPAIIANSYGEEICIGGNLIETNEPQYYKVKILKNNGEFFSASNVEFEGPLSKRLLSTDPNNVTHNEEQIDPQRTLNDSIELPAPVAAQ